MSLREDLVALLRARDVRANAISQEFQRDLERMFAEMTDALREVIEEAGRDGVITPDEQIQIEKAQDIRALLEASGLDDALDKVDADTLDMLDALQETARERGVGEAFLSANPDQLAELIDLQRDQLNRLARNQAEALVAQMRRVIVTGARLDEAVRALEFSGVSPSRAYTEVNTAVLDTYQGATNSAAESTTPDGYVYLGPDDGLTRPFCDAVVGRWFTREEIDGLDNAQLGTVFQQRGGWNCRHSWLPLYGKAQLAEFPHGDVAAANLAALGRRAA